MGGGAALINLLRGRIPGTPTYDNGYSFNNGHGRNTNNNNNNNNNGGGYGISDMGGITKPNEPQFQTQCKCTQATIGRQLSGCPAAQSGGTVARIICGMTAHASDWPWHTVVYYKQRLCGGSLVANNFVITAAHCLTWVIGIFKKEQRVNSILTCYRPDDGRYDTDADNKLYFGVSDITDRDGSEQWAKIKAIHRHPSFQWVKQKHIYTYVYKYI